MPQAALDHSLPIKRREAGLQTLVLWGRLLTRNGKVCTAPAVHACCALTRPTLFERVLVQHMHTQQTQREPDLLSWTLQQAL